MDEDDVTETMSLGDYMATFRRRRSFIAVSVLGVFLISVIVAIVLPPVYESTATIMIEGPEVPNSLVRSTVSSDQDARLRSVQERVMSTQNVMNIIDKLNLYPKERNTVPASVLASRISADTHFALVNPDGPRGRQDTDAVAFTLTFDASSPAVAQQVNNELVTLYLSENLRLRQAQAQGAVGFFSAETQRLADQIHGLETKLADFKTKHAGNLPDDFQLNMQLLDRTQQQLGEIMREEDSSRGRQAAMQSQLVQLNPNLPITAPDGQPILSGESLRLQYLALSAKLGENNPQVVGVRRQMEAMGLNPSATASRVDLVAQRTSLESQLSDARKKLGDNNPQVQSLSRQLSAVKSKLAALASPAAASDPEGATNPAYIQMRSQLAMEATNLQALAAQEQALRSKIEVLDTRISQSPQVERDYMELKRAYDDAVSNYQQLTAKQNDAVLANNLETQRMGEKFSVIEPPDLPTIPVAPKRKMIAAVGLVFGLLAGIGGALGLDAVSGRVYGSRRVASLTGANPLGVIPQFASQRRDLHERWWEQPKLLSVLTRVRAGVGSRR